MLDSQTLLSRYRAFLARSRRFLAVCWCFIYIGLATFLGLVWFAPTRETGASRSTITFILLVELLLAIAALALFSMMGNHSQRLARRLGLTCPDCGRPLSESTIHYALDTGQCWHCHPPVAAEEACVPAARLAPDSGNPYQPPTIAQAPPALAAEIKPQAPLTPLGGPIMLMFGGPLAYLIIWQCLLGSEETWWQQNRFPPGSYRTPEAEADHRRSLLRLIRRQGWYLLGPLIAVPSLAALFMLAFAPPAPSSLAFFTLSTAAFLVSSSAAYWAASTLLALGPRSFRRWIMGSSPPAESEIDSETGLLCIQVTFPKHDLSPLPKLRSIQIHWRSDDVQPLRVMLWRRGRGVIHQQDLPPAAGQWTLARTSVPFALAGEDARWSDIKLLLVLQPPGKFQVDEARL
jgi:hypothetical protein